MAIDKFIVFHATGAMYALSAFLTSPSWDFRRSVAFGLVNSSSSTYKRFEVSQIAIAYDAEWVDPVLNKIHRLHWLEKRQLLYHKPTSKATSV